MAIKEPSKYSLVTPPKGKKADSVYVLTESAHIYELNGWTVETPKADEVEGNPINLPDDPADLPEKNTAPAKK